MSLEGQMFFFSSEYLLITEAMSCCYIKSLVENILDAGTAHEDHKKLNRSPKPQLYYAVDISLKDKRVLHRFYPMLYKYYHMCAVDKINRDCSTEVIITVLDLKVTDDHYDSISNRIKSSDFIFDISSPLPPPDISESDVSLKCASIHNSLFCGVPESDENEDLNLSHCDGTSLSTRDCEFLYMNEQASNYNFYFVGVVLFVEIILIKFEALKKETLLHHKDAADENQQEPVADTKVKIQHHQEQFVREGTQLIRNTNPNVKYSVKHRLKRYRMNKYRMYLVLFLSHLKHNHVTKNTDVQVYNDNKGLTETSPGRMPWTDFGTNKNTKAESLCPVNNSSCLREITGRELIKGVDKHVFYDCKKENMPVKATCENVCDEDSGRDSTLQVCYIKKSNTSSQIHVKDSNLNSVKTLQNNDPKASLSEKGDFTSFLNVLIDLGLNLKLPDGRHMFWQEIMVYPLTRRDPEVNTPQGDPHQFMHYEVFRLCSFSYTRFPSNVDVWVTQLAQAGFYCFDQNGHIICFDCGQEFQGAANSPIENVHRPGCLHHMRSRPLHMWTQGLNQEVLAIYYNRYGSLRPYNFETSAPVGNTLQHADGARETGSSSHPTNSDPHNNELAPNSASLNRESDISSLAMADRDDTSARGGIQHPYHSATVSSVANEMNVSFPFSEEHHSLPGNLNDVSGAIVSEESVVDSPGNLSEIHQVLTSAARNPVPFYNTASHSHQSQQAEGGADNGAVGGAEPTLDLSKASYPLFSSAAARRQTFSAWRPDHTHRPDDLVAAGFFYAGYADCVRCFYCGLGLKYWRPTDIPTYQHARYRPHCVYNLLYKGQDYINRVQEDVQHEQGPAAANQVTNQNPLPRPSAQDEVAAPPPPVVSNPAAVQSEVTPAPAAVSVSETTPQVSTLMDSAVAQEALRNGYQSQQVQQAIDYIIRELGESCLEINTMLDVFANLNINNRNANPSRGESTGISNSGNSDNTMVRSSEASVLVPSPENITVNRSQQSVDVADSVQEQIGTQPQTRATPIQQPAAPQLEFADIFRTVEREHTLLAERTTCRLCHMRQVSCIFLPCGHVIACQECADNATHCSLCAKQIIGTANIYLA